MLDIISVYIPLSRVISDTDVSPCHVALNILFVYILQSCVLLISSYTDVSPCHVTLNIISSYILLYHVVPILYDIDVPP